MVKLRRKNNSADEEINKLQALRQVLVEKNLSGTYSDEIFKEQNGIIEQKLIAAHGAKDQERIDKYDISKINSFLEDKLSNLARTYSTTKDLSPLRTLLSTIFISGFNWSYPGISYKGISPIYQAIRDADKSDIDVGCPTYKQFVLQLAWIEQLRQVFEIKKEESI